MKKNLVRKSKKRKINLPLQINHNPQEIAQQHLFQISDQYQILNQNNQNQNQDFLKTQQQSSLNQSLLKTTQFISSKRKTIQIKPINFKNNYLSQIFNQSLHMINILQSKQVYVGKKSAINVTNYTVLDNRDPIKIKSTYSPSHRTNSSEKNKIPTSFRKILRRKSVSNSVSTFNQSFQYIPKQMPLTPKQKSVASKKLDMTLKTNSIYFQRPYLLSNQKL